MAKNKIITTQGNVQFINSKGRTINVHPMHVYSVYDGDTVSFLFLGMKDYSGQAFFSSQMEDLEVNGVIYDDMDDLKAAIGEAFAKSGAQARTEIVTELPEDPYTNTIYLLPKEHGEGYDEYIWNEDEGWQLIGDTDIEWERYLQIADFNVYSAATAEEISYISGAVDTNAADIVALSGAIDTEIAAREAADAYISGAVDTVSADLATESQRAVSAETALQNNINAANARIDAEQTARALADTFISGAVDTEVSNRISADTALQTAIDNEASARTDADSALSDKIDYVSGAVDTEVSARGAADSYISGAVDTLSSVKADKANAVASAVYVSSSTTIDLKNISGEVISQVDASDFIVDGMVEDVRIENGYLIIDFNTASGIEDIEIPLTDIFNPANYYDKDDIDGIVSGINDSIADEVSARTDADTALQSAIDTVSGNVETETSRATSAETALQTAIDNEISARTAAIEAIEGEISGISDSLSAYSTTVEMNAAIDAAVSGKADSSSLATVATSGSYNDLTNKPTIPTVPTSNTAFTNDAGYITVDALSGYAESSAVTEEITAAVSGKQDTLSAGTNITIVDNVISAEGGGGKAISAGTNISVTTGETADTVSCTLPISATSEGIYTTSANPFRSNSRKSGNVVFGSNNYIDVFGSTRNSKYNAIFGNDNAIAPIGGDSSYNFIAGEYNKVTGGSAYYTISYCSIFGENNIASNTFETSFGFWNNSVNSSNVFGTSGNTLFSVGNGTASNARHNAFEIRQNGDIYITSGGTDIKLQDNLGSTVEISSAITSGDTNAVAGGAVYDKFDEVETRLTEDEEVTAAGLNALNDKFGGLKLMKISQSDYDNLQVKDNNTLYIISD